MDKVKAKIVKILCSLPLVIILLGLIILACALGTFIPQYLPPSEYIGKYGRAAYQLLSLAKLNDVYHAWWFIALLSLLGSSLGVCTLRQLKSWRKSCASIITHLGLLVILLGALATGVFGEKGFLMVHKGYSQDVFLDSNNKFKKLDFKIYLDDFEVEWYDSYSNNKNSRQVKDYRSKIVVIDNGKAALAKIVRVNYPLSFKGYTFYQASYDSQELTWTGLEVVKDSGAPFVYIGFILLNIGVVLIFSFGPKHKVIDSQKIRF